MQPRFDYQSKHHQQRMKAHVEEHYAREVQRLFRESLELRQAVDALPDRKPVDWKWWYWLWMPKEK